MWKILRRMLHMLSLAVRDVSYSRCWRAAFMFGDRGQRLKTSDWIPLVDSEYYEDERAGSKSPWRTTGRTKTVLAFHVCGGGKCVSQAWSSRRVSWVRRLFVQWIHILFDSVLFLQIQNHTNTRTFTYACAKSSRWTAAKQCSIQKPVPIPPSFWTYSGTARAPRQVWPRRTGTQLQVQPIHELHQQNYHTIGWLLLSQSRNSSRNSAYYYISNCCP